jgi:hypothetical protein
MAAAKLSDDLTHLISEPIELFRADSPSWSNRNVTDGCFMYTTKENELLMLWSNFNNNEQYCVGIAKSDNGKIDGNWIQDDRLLFEADGGHGMIFKADGKLYFTYHQPNNAPLERPHFVEIEEKDDTLFVK